MKTRICAMFGMGYDWLSVRNLAWQEISNTECIVIGRTKIEKPLENFRVTQASLCLLKARKTFSNIPLHKQYSFGCCLFLTEIRDVLTP